MCCQFPPTIRQRQREGILVIDSMRRPVPLKIQGAMENGATR